MAFDTFAVANQLLTLAKAEGRDVTPMKLQKLLYYAHGWFLALHDQPLLDRSIEAWQFGPVVSPVYHEFKEFGNRPIPRLAYKWEGFGYAEPEPIELPSSPEYGGVREFLRELWEVYGPYSAVALMNDTHKPGTPWKQVFDQHHGAIPPNVVIPDGIIKAYFKQVAAS